MDKAGLRENIRNLRKALEPDRREALSRLAQERLLAGEPWASAGSVALYVAARQEVETWLLLENAWNNGKKVYLPRVEPGGQGLMNFVPCLERGQLSPGAFGIPEPLPELRACLFAGVNEADSALYDGYELQAAPDLFILPGLAFDRFGHRLGWGGGFYDRFLARRKRWDLPAPPVGRPLTAVGLAYSFQLMEAIPHDPWDEPVDAVCTDQEFLWIRKRHE